MRQGCGRGRRRNGSADLPHERAASLYFCRHCGAAHPEPVARCLHCGMAGTPVLLYAVRQSRDNPGMLRSCLSCRTIGRRIGSLYREPARPVRATNVADVHVLAQDMVHHSERHRLLVFCDNRQYVAIEKLLKREVSRMDELKQRLLRQKNDFEKKYGMSSEEFNRQYEKGTMGDEMDYVEWSANVDMLSGTEKRLSLLQQETSA